MASILPLSFPHNRPSPGPALAGRGFNRRESHVTVKTPSMLKRIVRVNHMDFELAAWNLTYLCIRPRLVYKQLFYHKQTKNIWARDDPATVILVILALALSAIGWGIYYQRSLFGVAYIAVLMVLRDFLGVGIIMATAVWLLSKVFLIPPDTASHEIGSSLEWSYAFDVHTNSFFPLYLSLYLVQLFLAPLITRDRWVCLWLGNTLYLVAFAQYTYITYLGVNALPFLIRSELLLFPLVPLILLYVVSLLGFNVSSAALKLYFG